MSEEAREQVENSFSLLYTATMINETRIATPGRKSAYRICGFCTSMHHAELVHLTLHHELDPSSQLRTEVELMLLKTRNNKNKLASGYKNLHAGGAVAEDHQNQIQAGLIAWTYH